MWEESEEYDQCPYGAKVVHLKSYRSEKTDKIYNVYEIRVNEYAVNGVYAVTCDDEEVERVCYTTLNFEDALKYAQDVNNTKCGDVEC